MDGKYIYNLDLKALALGAGTYTAGVKIDGTAIPGAATFALK